MSFDPYHQWLGVPPEEQPADHYRLLSLTRFESNSDVIENAADRQMAHVRTFQTGSHSAESQRILNELSAAKLCLLDREKRAAYDRGLRRPLEAAKAVQRRVPVAKPLPAAPVLGVGAHPEESEPLPLLVTDRGTAPRASQKQRTKSNRPMAIWTALGVTVFAAIVIVGAAIRLNKPQPAPKKEDPQHLHQTASSEADKPGEKPTSPVAVTKVIGGERNNTEAPTKPRETDESTFLMSRGGTLPMAADGRPLNFDFETGDLKDWTADGDAFGHQPMDADTVGVGHEDQRCQQNGRFWISTKERSGTPSTGTLTSAPFNVTHPYASFLLAAESPLANLAVDLVRSDDNRTVARVVGSEGVRLRPVAVDLSEHVGQNIIIRIGDWDDRPEGIIGFDDFRFHKTKPDFSPHYVSSEDLRVGSPVNVLALLDIDRDSRAGAWAWDEHKWLAAVKGGWKMMQLPFPAPDEYDLSVTLEGAPVLNDIDIVLPVGGRQCHVGIQHFRDPYLSGLHLVDGKSLDQNETRHEGTVFRDGAPNELVFQVRARSVKISCNGTTFIDWKGDPRRLSPRWTVAGWDGLLIGGGGVPYRIGKFELTLVGQQETSALAGAGADAPLPTSTGLEIIEARWGAGQNWADVTAAMQAGVFDGRYIGIVNESTLGKDPVPLVVKKLIVRYRIAGESQAQTFSDFGLVYLTADRPPAVHKPGLTLLEAKYGTGRMWVDVLERLRPLVKDSSLDVLVDHLPNIDPAPGKDKLLFVRYAADGKTQHAGVPAGEILQIDARSQAGKDGAARRAPDRLSMTEPPMSGPSDTQRVAPATPDRKAARDKQPSVGDVVKGDTSGTKAPVTAAELTPPLKHHTGGVTRVLFHRALPLLVSTGKDGRVVAWNLDKQNAPTELHKFRWEVWTAKFSPDGELLAFADRQNGESEVLFKTVADGRQVHAIKDYIETRRWAVASLAFSPDGRLFATGQDDGTIRLWELPSFTEFTPVSFGGNAISLAFGRVSVDKKHKRSDYVLAVGCWGAPVRTMDVTFSKEKTPAASRSFTPTDVAFEETDRVECVRFSPDGELLAVTGHGGHINLYDVRTGESRRKMPFVGGEVTWIAFHPQQPWCVTTHRNERMACIWNYETAELLCQLKGHAGGVLCAEFSPDGRRVATASEDFSIKLWDLSGSDVPPAPKKGKAKKTKILQPIVGD